MQHDYWEPELCRISRWQQCGKIQIQGRETDWLSTKKTWEIVHHIFSTIFNELFQFALWCLRISLQLIRIQMDYVFFSHFKCNQNAHTLKKKQYKMQNKHISSTFICLCLWLVLLTYSILQSDCAQREQTGMLGDISGAPLLEDDGPAASWAPLAQTMSAHTQTHTQRPPSD